MAKLTSSEKILYFGGECHTPKNEEIVRSFVQTFNETYKEYNEKDIEQAIIDLFDAFPVLFDLMKRAYESGYNEGSLNAVKAFVKDADKAPNVSMQTYFEAYKKQIGD